MKISGPGESPLLFLKVIKILNQKNIPYAVIGAFAASFYGLVRASLDVDALISLKGSEETLDDLSRALNKGTLKASVRRGDFQDPIQAVVNIQDKFQNRVDLLIGIKGTREDVFERVKTTTFMKQRINIVSLEDFVAMKISAGRAKDIQDVIGVLHVSRPQMDLPLLKKVTRQYGKKELDKLGKILNQLSD
jgi:predicted nucleotidyltransferase